MAAPDRAYNILLSQLHRPSPALPLESLQSLLSHCLSHTQTATAATPLTATIISSPLFRPFSHTKLAALSSAFRHAAHLRLASLKQEPQSIWSRGVNGAMHDWAKAVIKGFAGGQGILRLVAAGGLLLALEDLRYQLGAETGHSRVRRRAEEEVVIAVAEVMDVYATLPTDGWEKEFHPHTERGEVDALSLALVFASQFLPLVSSDRLTALPLHTLLDILISSVESAFQSGSFLTTFPSLNGPADVKSRSRHPSTASQPSSSSIPYSSATSPVSSASLTINALTSSPLFTSIASLSKLCARVITLLVETRPHEGWVSISKVLARLQDITSQIDNDWIKSPLARGLDDEPEIPEVQKLTGSLWTIFKTLLFTSVMITQSVLSAVLYTVPPTVPSSDSKAREDNHPPSASIVALSVLQILSNLSFVISQFGGVTSQTEGGFTELRRTFYTALDVLSADVSASEIYVRKMASREEPSNPLPSSSSSVSLTNTRAHPTESSKRALDLACIEQLVPLLSLVTIETSVFPLCLPYLYDSSDRELYESAHSVVLSTFASHARKELKSDHPAHFDSQEDSSGSFLEKIVPYYSKCLLDNSGHGKLSTVQLRLAYTALVGSANASSPVMAQYCISALLDKTKQVSASSEGVESEREQLHRLQLTLISTISALPLSLLPGGVLHEIRSMLVMGNEPREIVVEGSEGEEDEGRELEGPRDELVQALYREILEGVGDREKEFMIGWWVDMKDALGGGDVATVEEVVGDVLRKGKRRAEEDEEKVVVVPSRL